MEEKTQTKMAEYERKRAKICARYERMCFTRKCPLRKVNCYDATALRICDYNWRKQIYKEIDKIWEEFE